MEKENYFLLKLPSKGLCYPIDSPLRSGEIRLSYLTVKDENIIIDFEIYKNKNILDLIIKNNIIDKKIDIDSLCSADKNFIFFNLLKHSYGDNLLIILENEKEKIKVPIKLITLEYEEMIYSDDNGYLKYFYKNDILKFKILSEKEIEQIENSENINDFIKYSTKQINNNSDEKSIGNFIDNMDTFDKYLYYSFISENTPKIKIKVNNKTYEKFFIDINNL